MQRRSIIGAMKPWTFTDVARIFRLAEQGHLRPDGLRRAAAHAPLVPSATVWDQWLDRLLAFGAAVLLAAALISFFAYNWADLDRFAKFGIAVAALGGSVLTAMLLPPRSTGWHAALLAAALAIGALFALIGQTYQTGADAWELFAAWAVMMLPFVLLSRSLPLWALWLLVGNLALARGFAQSAGLELPNASGLLWMVAANLGLVVACELLPVHIAAGGPRSARRLARLAALVLWLVLAFGACLGWYESDYLPLLLAHVVLAALSGWRHYTVRRDVVMLGLMLYSSIAVVAAGLFRLSMESSFSLLTIGALVAAASAGVAGWLHHLINETAQDEDHDD